jgi:hypothetical protein
MDGLLKVGLFAAGGSLLCFVASGDGGLMAIWSAVALLLAPLIVIKLRRDAAEPEAAPTGNRHHNYVFASETATPRRRRKVVA